MNIFKKDFKTNIRSTIIWTVSASILAYFAVSVYSSTIASNSNQWNDLLQTMPKTLLDAFEINKLSFDTVLGFYAVKGYLYVNLILAVFAAMLGAKLINKEESERTTEFALTKPISRFNYITQKLVTLITLVTLSNLVTTIMLYIGLLVGSSASLDMNGFILYSLGTYLIALSFGLIVFALACLTQRRRGLTGLAIGIVFLSFFLGIISNLSNTFENLKYLSLFKYMDPSDLIKNGMSTMAIVVFTVIIIGSIITSYTVYLKKDIYN